MKWLFLVHQVQTPNSRERVKVWRLIKKSGAVLHRNSVYVLPYSKERLEDFQWLCQQIRDSKGEASVFVSQPQDKEEDGQLRALFVRARKEDYVAILLSAERLMTRIVAAKKQRRMTKGMIKKFSREEGELLQNMKDTQRVDFFSNRVPARFNRVFLEIRKHLSTSQTVTSDLPGKCDRKDFQRKVWTTRQHIHIDRLCSAWLIRRFIDRQATFIFAPEGKLPKDAIAFDVLGARFSHHGENCTFETLARSFEIQDPAIRIIGEMIHDVDLKDHKFNRPEGPGLDIVIRALSGWSQDDHQVLKNGCVILDALYDYYLKRPVVKKR